jgi:general secretion pathway protein D
MRIPVIGQLFRVDTEKTARTELIVLITPYVVNDGSDARHYTEAFRAILPLLEPQFAPPTKPVYPYMIAPAGPPLWPSLESPPSSAPNPPPAKVQP